MPAQKFFRYLWRTNAVLILFAAAAITFGVGALLWEESGARSAARRNSQAGIAVAPESKEDLTLAHAEIIPGSAVLRADLFLRRESKGFSSGGRYPETRNILFIDPTQKAAHWLLPDNEHVIIQKSDITDEKDPLARRTVAMAVFVKPRNQELERVPGQLLLVDAAGTKTIEISKDVTDLHIARLNGNELIVLYERNNRLVLTAFDSGSLLKKREQEIDIPQFR
jgi:hypothetical protein